jgi:hypothetical protein
MRFTILLLYGFTNFDIQKQFKTTGKLVILILWLSQVLFKNGICFSSDVDRINPVSSYSGKIEKLILIYTRTAEIGIISLIDIMKALPDVEITVISQFDPDSKEFGLFVSSLTRNDLGFNSQHKPRIHFIQDARSYGPWPSPVFTLVH